MFNRSVTSRRFYLSNLGEQNFLPSDYLRNNGSTNFKLRNKIGTGYDNSALVLQGDAAERRALLQHYKQNELYRQPLLGRGQSAAEEEEELNCEKKYDVSEYGNIILDDVEEKVVGDKIKSEDMPFPGQILEYIVFQADIQQKTVLSRHGIGDLQTLNRKEFREWKKMVNEQKKEDREEKKQKILEKKNNRRNCSKPKTSRKKTYQEILKAILDDDEGENLFTNDELPFDNPEYFMKRNVTTSMGVLKLNAKQRKKARLKNRKTKKCQAIALKKTPRRPRRR